MPQRVRLSKSNYHWYGNGGCSQQTASAGRFWVIGRQAGSFLVIEAHGGTWFRTPCPIVVRSRPQCDRTGTRCDFLIFFLQSTSAYFFLEFFFLFFDEIIRALRGCCCGSRGFLEDWMMDVITGRAPPTAQAESHDIIAPIAKSSRELARPGPSLLETLGRRRHRC